MNTIKSAYCHNHLFLRHVGSKHGENLFIRVNCITIDQINIEYLFQSKGNLLDGCIFQ